MPGLIGKKIGMTRIFNEDGKNIPCTIIQAGPCVVTQLKTNEADGYAAVQLAYDEQKETRITKALAGHFSKAKTTAKKKLVEFEMPDEEVNLGDTIAVDIIEEELLRGGQVYFLHNKIHSIPHKVKKLREFFPKEKNLFHKLH